jgi:hypothetical protein
MEVRLEPHTLERAEERGTNRKVVEDVLTNEFEFSAHGGRKGKARIYDFNRERLGKYYKQKRVEVIYAEEKNMLITVTVYVYYGEWKA